jgi:hypothetical protein
MCDGVECAIADVEVLRGLFGQRDGIEWLISDEVGVEFVVVGPREAELEVVDEGGFEAGDIATVEVDRFEVVVGVII